MDQKDDTDTSDFGGNCGFQLFNLDSPGLPILISVPHAGREYPTELLENLRIAPAELQRLEDRYADRLVAPAIAAGMPAIVARRARAWIDLNRGEDELDPEMIKGGTGVRKTVGSAKMRGGLGLVPRRLMHSGDIWLRPFEAQDVEQRLSGFHRPYHQQVEKALLQMRDLFGIALLVDMHSMPPLLPVGGFQPHIVIGDRFGQSAASLYSEMLLQRLKQIGVAAALNHPYPGDYILRRHGNVRKNIHAIQIEVDRALYLDSELREPASGLEATSAIITELMMLLAELVGGASIPMAAE